MKCEKVFNDLKCLLTLPPLLQFPKKCETLLYLGVIEDSISLILVIKKMKIMYSVLCEEGAKRYWVTQSNKGKACTHTYYIDKTTLIILQSSFNSSSH